jgi:RNA polymerase sigma factor (sigma-70 family)
VARRGMHLLFQQAGWLANGPQPGDPTDGSLLNVCVNDGDTSGMDALVRRHGPMVWTTCKQMLPDPSEAEDAFQATFLVLVQSAKTLRRVKSLGGWLHGVAVKICWKQRRGAVRRKHRDSKTAKPEAMTPKAEPAWDGLYSAVHDEVEKLPATLRTAFVLCELQGTRPSDAAAQLGWKIGTLSGRLTRARQQLMKKLTARGFAPLVVVAATATTAAQATAPLGEALLAAGAVIHHPANLLPSTVLGLAKAITGGVTMKMKLVLASGVLITGLTVGLGWKHSNEANAQVAAPPGSALPNSGAVPPGGATPGAAGAPAATKPAEKPKPADKLPGTPAPGGMGPGGSGAPASWMSGPGSPPTGVAGGGMTGAAPKPASTAVEYTTTLVPNNLTELNKLLTQLGSDGWVFAGQVTLGDKDSKLVFSKAPKVQPRPQPGLGASNSMLFPGQPALPPNAGIVRKSEEYYDPKTNTTTKVEYAVPAEGGSPGMASGSGATYPALVRTTPSPVAATNSRVRAEGESSKSPPATPGARKTFEALEPYDNLPSASTTAFNPDKTKPKIEVIKPKEGTNLSSMKEVAMVVLGAVAKEEGVAGPGQDSVLVTESGYIIITGASPKALETLREVLSKIQK